MFYGWWTVGVCVVVMAVSGGLYQQASTILLLPIGRDLHLSRGAASLIFGLARAETGLTAPILGWITDRYGARRVIVGSALLAFGGYVWLSQVNDFISFLLVYAIVVPLGFQSGFSTAALALANQWFIRRRAIALALVTAGIGVGGAIFVPLLGLSTAVFGWRLSVALAGAAALIIVLPLSLVVRDRPEDVGLLPDGDERAADGKENDDEAARTDLGVAEGLRNRAFWLFVAATSARTMAQNAVAIHLVPILVWKGLSEPQAAGFVGVLALLTVPLRIGVAWLGDRTSRHGVLSIAMLAGGLGVSVMSVGDSGLYAGMFIVLLAVSEGTPGLTWALLADLVGRRRFATFRGVTNMATQLGVVGVPILAGWTFDLTQSYVWTLLGAAFLFATSAGLFWLLHPRSLLMLSRPAPMRSQG